MMMQVVLLIRVLQTEKMLVLMWKLVLTVSVTEYCELQLMQEMMWVLPLLLLLLLYHSGLELELILKTVRQSNDAKACAPSSM